MTLVVGGMRLEVMSGVSTIHVLLQHPIVIKPKRNEQIHPP